MFIIIKSLIVFNILFKNKNLKKKIIIPILKFQNYKTRGKNFKMTI